MSGATRVGQTPKESIQCGARVWSQNEEPEPVLWSQSEEPESVLWSQSEEPESVQVSQSEEPVFVL